MMDLNEFHERREAEQLETRAADLWERFGDGLGHAMFRELDYLNTARRRCGCPACHYLYAVVWLGQERISRILSERDEYDEHEGYDERGDIDDFLDGE